MIRTKNLALLFSIALVLSSCAGEEPAPPPVQNTATQTGELVLASTNDFHAALDRAEGLASVIRDLRKKYEDKLVYLDAGDQFQGSLEGNMSKGKAVIELFSLIGLDAAAMGNHELDYGPDVPQRVSVRKGEDGMGSFKKRAKEAKYPFLSANFTYDPPVSCAGPGPECNALYQKTILPPRTIIERGGQRIGVIGATTPVTANITDPEFIRGKKFDPMAPVIEAEAKWLREQKNCKWILLVVHEGLRYERDGKTLKDTALLTLLKQLPPGIVDAIVGGHSHIQIRDIVQGFPLLQTGISGQVVGVMHLSKNAGKTEARFENFIPVPDTAVAFDVTRVMLFYRQLALDKKRKVIAKTTAPFPQDKTSESALGNLMADAVLHIAQRYGGADFAVMNAGGIRSGLPEGTLTYDNAFKLMPFSNNLVIVEMTGKELTSLLEIAFSGALGPASISGLKVTCARVSPGVDGPWMRDISGDGKKEDWERDLLLEVQSINGTPVQNDKTYRLATNTFLVEGGDYQDFVYDQIPPSRIHIHYDVIIRDLLADYFKAQSPLAPVTYYSESKARIRYADN